MELAGRKDSWHHVLELSDGGVSALESKRQSVGSKKSHSEIIEAMPKPTALTAVAFLGAVSLFHSPAQAIPHCPHLAGDYKCVQTTMTAETPFTMRIRENQRSYVIEQSLEKVRAIIAPIQGHAEPDQLNEKPFADCPMGANYNGTILRIRTMESPNDKLERKYYREGEAVVQVISYRGMQIIRRCKPDNGARF